MKCELYLDPAMNEIVFAKRNQLYGAYDLRHRYDGIMAKALISSIALFLFCIGIPFMLQLYKMQNIREIEIIIHSPVINLEDLNQVIPIKPPEVVRVQNPPSIKSQIKFIPPVVVAENEIIKEELPPGIDDLKGKQIDFSTTGSEEGLVDPGLMTNTQGVFLLPETKSETEVYPSYSVQQQPEFPGGMAAMYKFLSRELKYTPLAKETGISGTVIIQFVVSKEGKIENAYVVRGLGGGLDQEALRVVRLMPDWRPGKHNDKPVAVNFTLPIRFQLIR